MLSILKVRQKENSQNVWKWWRDYWVITLFHKLIIIYNSIRIREIWNCEQPYSLYNLACSFLPSGWRNWSPSSLALRFPYLAHEEAWWVQPNSCFPLSTPLATICQMVDLLESHWQPQVSSTNMLNCYHFWKASQSVLVVMAITLHTHSWVIAYVKCSQPRQE